MCSMKQKSGDSIDSFLNKLEIQLCYKSIVKMTGAVNDTDLDYVAWFLCTHEPQYDTTQV